MKKCLTVKAYITRQSDSRATPGEDVGRHLVSITGSWSLFYLNLMKDIFSRKIVGYKFHEEKNVEQAAALLHHTVLREGCYRHPLVLHADNSALKKS
ncbi:hypothetical protein GP924_26515 [Enterobacteriaceae bacterium 8376wB9]|nr:hypothetical protein [Enterobacteriaceae bacterium 8376wB9]